MEKKTINLGRVGFAPKGAYSPEVTYGRMHVVTYKNTTYWSKQEDNLNHEPNGETEWWGVLVDGQAAYNGANDAIKATERANTAAEKADAATEKANSATSKAVAATDTVNAAVTNANDATAKAKKATEVCEAIVPVEDARVKAESSRVEAESSRVSAEQSRAVAEQSRGEAESQRTAAETKRNTDELSRQSNETDRKEAEAARVEAEQGRVDAEQSRVAAEKQREATLAKTKADCDAATQKATDAANEATLAKTKAEDATDNCNTATEGAERVDATITEANVLQVTDRNGTQKTLDLAAVVKANSVAEDVDRIKESMGAYSDRPDITLTAKENNVAISADGVKVSKSGWAIAEFTAELGNIYLFNPGETSADVCVFAEYIDKQETRAIDYAYTYDESGRVLTAKATYNGKTYTYSYDYSSSITAITDQDGNSVSSLPSVYTTTVGAYQPMTILNANAELPEDGYCRFVSNFTTASAIKIVVSYKVASADLTMKVVRDGSTANMCSQLAKINKKVDEVSEKVPKMWIRIVNNEGVYIKKDVVSLNFDKNLKKCDIHYNGLAPIKSILFYQCLKLTDLDVSCLDTSAVTSLSYAFWNCQNLKTPDFSGWNTSNVKSMQRMFYGCPFDSPDVNSWDTGKVTDMSYAFVSNKGKVDLSAWNTSNVENMTGVFWNANYTVINVSGWDTSKVAKMGGIFLNQTITTLTFGENFGKMKDACGTLDLSSLSAWNNDSVKSLLTLYDRKANGMGVITIKLHANAKAVLGEDGIEQLTAKGYTIA